MTFRFEAFDGSVKIGEDIVLNKDKTESDYVTVSVNSAESGKDHTYSIKEKTAANGTKGITYDAVPNKELKVRWTSNGRGTLVPVYSGSEGENGTHEKKETT